MLYTAEYESPIGRILLAERDGKLVGAWLAGQKNGLEVFDGTEQARETEGLVRVKHWFDSYFSGGKPDLCQLRLAPSGTPFRLLVWELLKEIPYGQVTTYGNLAKKAALALGKPMMSAQAIGGAVGHNPIAIIIPCHRVVGVNGELTGYDGGIAMKARLLAHEAESPCSSKVKSEATLD